MKDWSGSVRPSSFQAKRGRNGNLIFTLADLHGLHSRYSGMWMNDGAAAVLAESTAKRQSDLTGYPAGFTIIPCGSRQDVDE
jgi:hypothetical protein